MRKHKFGAIPKEVDGIKFSSTKEANRFQHVLKPLLRAGRITDLSLQPTYPIIINGIPICKVKLDFKYYDLEHECEVIEDVKGMDLPLSKLKRKLVEAMHGIKVVLV